MWFVCDSECGYRFYAGQDAAEKAFLELTQEWITEYALQVERHGEGSQDVADCVDGLESVFMGRLVKSVQAVQTQDVGLQVVVVAMPNDDA